MSAFIEATKWPDDADPDDTTALLQCLIVDERTPSSAAAGQHMHRNGQFVVALSGLVGLRIGDREIAFPPSSAAWVPPGLFHEGFLGEGAASLYCLITPDWARMLPQHPYRLLLDPMTIEMLKRFTRYPVGFLLNSHEARLARVLFEELMGARQLPLSFVPLSSHPALKRIAEALVKNPGDSRRTREWADLCAMSERTLARLVVRETGLSFGAWRLRIIMLAATHHLLAGECVEEVAERIGYSSAFTAAFRRVFGLTPGMLRRGEAGLLRDASL